MKKIFILFFVISMCLCTACGSSSNVDGRMKKVAEQMISAVDQYLDFEIEASEAEEKIENLYTRVIEPDDNASKEDKDLYLYITHLDSQMRYASYQITKKDATGLAEAEKSVLNARNNIARIIGAKKR